MTTSFVLGSMRQSAPLGPLVITQTALPSAASLVGRPGIRIRWTMRRAFPSIRTTTFRDGSLAQTVSPAAPPTTARPPGATPRIVRTIRSSELSISRTVRLSWFPTQIASGVGAAGGKRRLLLGAVLMLGPTRIVLRVGTGP